MAVDEIYVGWQVEPVVVCRQYAPRHVPAEVSVGVVPEIGDFACRANSCPPFVVLTLPLNLHAAEAVAGIFHGVPGVEAEHIVAKDCPVDNTLTR